MYATQMRKARQHNTAEVINDLEWYLNPQAAMHYPTYSAYISSISSLGQEQVVVIERFYFKCMSLYVTYVR